MILVDHPLVFWLMSCIQVAGLFSVAATRVGEHTSAYMPCRWVFFACLLLVGLATIASLASGMGQWAGGGATLSVMAVGATLDLRSDVQKPTC